MADMVYSSSVLFKRNNRFTNERVGRRILRDDSNPLELMSDAEVHRRYRFRKTGVMFLVEMVGSSIRRQTERSNALPPLLQVLVTLRFLATNSFYSVVADGLPRVATSTVCRVVWLVINALLASFATYVKFPSNDKLPAIKQQFFSIAGFPNIIGVVDGTQIPIIAPSTNESDYVNRKGVHAINVQMVCDPWYRITNVVAKWPGSVHDARILRESTLGRELQAGVHRGMLLGDSGYPCRRYLMVPYPNPQGRHQMRLNSSLMKTRVLIEQTFGILKRKFACLNMLRVTPQKACKIICVTAMLHNIAVQFHDIDDDGELHLTGPDDLLYGGDDREDGKHFRDHLALTYFNGN